MELKKRTKLHTDETFVFYKASQNIIEWFNSYGIYGENFNVFDARKMKNKIVCGMGIPLHVASFSWKTIELNIKNVLDKPMEALSVEEIDELWHQVRVYDTRSNRIYFEDKNWEKNLRRFKGTENVAHQTATSLVEMGIITVEQMQDVEERLIQNLK